MHAVRETRAVRRSAEPNILLHTRDATDALPQTAGVVPLPPVASVVRHPRRGGYGVLDWDVMRRTADGSRLASWGATNALRPMLLSRRPNTLLRTRHSGPPVLDLLVRVLPMRATEQSTQPSGKRRSFVLSHIGFEGRRTIGSGQCCRFAVSESAGHDGGCYLGDLVTVDESQSLSCLDGDAVKEIQVGNL